MCTCHLIKRGIRSQMQDLSNIVGHFEHEQLNRLDSTPKLPKICVK
jgi:hypothetical protein